MKTKIISFSLFLFLTFPITKAQTWEFVGLDSLLIKQLYVSGDTIWAGTISRIDTNKISGVYRSTDRGSSWIRIDTSLGKRPVICLYVDLNSETIWLVKQLNNISPGGTLFRSLNRGEDWQLISQLETISIEWLGISPLDKDNIYVMESSYFPTGVYETIYRSTDNGTNWLEITSTFPASSHGRSMVFNQSLTDGSKLFAAVNDRIGSSYFFVSTNKGDNWINISEPPAVEKELITDPILSNMVFIFPGYHLTDDGGFNWTVADSGIQDVNSYLTMYIDPRDEQTYFNLRKDGLYKSSSDSIYWQLIEGTDLLPLNLGSQGFKYVEIGQLRNVFIDTLTQVLYLGTARGIYKKNLITEVEEKINYTPSEFILDQNYPNPFNPITIISYQIPEKSFVIMKVYDVLGNEIKTIVSEEKSPGKYQVEFNGSELSSGVYLYVMKANNFSDNKKFVLLK